jgi:hypothetical protein
MWFHSDSLKGRRLSAVLFIELDTIYLPKVNKSAVHLARPELVSAFNILNILANLFTPANALQ